MAIEIERKFLPRSSEEISRVIENHNGSSTISQSYLPNTGEWAVRVRKVETKIETWYCVEYFLTMKRALSDRSCVEIEHEINKKVYEEYRSQCSVELRKSRHIIHLDKMKWEIDVFANAELDGLVLIEVELLSEDTEVMLPEWVGREVTDDPQYRNFNLINRLRAIS